MAPKSLARVVWFALWMGMNDTWPLIARHVWQEESERYLMYGLIDIAWDVWPKLPTVELDLLFQACLKVKSDQMWDWTGPTVIYALLSATRLNNQAEERQLKASMALAAASAVACEELN